MISAIFSNRFKLWTEKCHLPDLYICLTVASRDDNKPIEIADENASRLKIHAMKAKSDPVAFLSMRDIFGDLENRDKFTSAFVTALTALWSAGTAVTLKDYISGELFDDHMLR